jgi:hypothetical protein
MIASFSQGIYHTDILLSFMLIPLATNGIVPIVFAYLLLFHYHKAGLGSALYTLLTYILSTVVYWSLYASVSSMSDFQRVTAYQQFTTSLASNTACGKYSALAVCPHIAPTGVSEVESSQRKIRVLTPIMWTFSTVVLFALMVYQLLDWQRHRNLNTVAAEQDESTSGQKTEPSHYDQGSLAWRTGFLVAVAAMLACLGMQLSTLSISHALKMLNTYSWPFGQIVAITIWAPPVLEYIYAELSKNVLSFYFVCLTSGRKHLCQGRSYQ